MNTTVTFAELHFMSSSDVQLFLNCHIKTAQQKLKKIREHLKRKPNTPITVQEYARYEGIPLSVLEHFKNWQHS